MSTEHYIGPTATTSIDENADMLEVYHRLGDTYIKGVVGEGASAQNGLAQQGPSQ